MDGTSHRGSDGGYASHLETLIALAEAVQSGLPAPLVFDGAVRRLVLALECDFAAVFELQPDSTEFLLVAGSGWQPGAVGFARVPAASSQCGFTIRSGEPVITDHVLRETRFPATRLLREHGVLSGASTVLPGAEFRPLRVLSVYSRRQGHFDTNAVRLLRATAQILGSSLARAAYDSRPATDRRQSDLLATLAHELRNPLSVARNAVALLREPVTRSEQMSLLDMVDDQVTHLTAVMDNLRQVVQVSQDPALRSDRLDLRGVISRALGGARERLTHAGQHVRLTLPETPVLVVGDEDRLVQAITHLLSNAAKFSDGPGHVNVALETGAGWARVKVKDTGRGIPPDHLPGVFDLFSRVEGRYSRSVGGVGAGLMLAQRLVRLHGGEITAFSDGPGAGSEFVVELPLATELRQRVPAIGRPAQVRQLARRILVVDDNVDACESLALLLRRQGHDAATETVAERVLTRADYFRPDLILLDVGLPGTDGLEVCRRLRQAGYDCPIVAVTGFDQDEDRRETAAAGFTCHLVKPLDPLSLGGLVRELLDMRDEPPASSARH